jgi:hypothetical protein
MPKPNQTRALGAIMDASRKAVGYADHTPAGMDEPTLRRSKPAAVAGDLDLRAAPAADLIAARGLNMDTAQPIDLRSLGVANASGAAGTPMYSAEAAAGSFAADARHAFDLLPRQTAVGRAGAVIREFPAPRGRIFTADAATFAPVNDDEPAPDGLVEFAEAGAWDLGDPASVQSWGCTIRATRRLVKLAGEPNFEALLNGAILRGIVGAVDAAALAAIAAARAAGIMPTPAEMAEAGIFDFDRVRAILGGGEYAGAAWDRGGVFFNGVPALPTDRLTDAAIVGDFSAVVILVDPVVRIVSNRLDAAGSLEITGFVDVMPVMLDPARLWNVADPSGDE